MNILDAVKEVLDLRSPVFLGILPDKPDEVTALFEYALPPEQYFDQTNLIYGVQARTRAWESRQAFAVAIEIQERLSRYSDHRMTILQTSSILGIGQDSKGRKEYTINFRVNYKEENHALSGCDRQNFNQDWCR